MKTVMLLYLFLLIAFFDLHAQYPILSPFAVSLGATPVMIGLLLGAYAIAHIPGNLLAGRAIDRFGSRPFISISLILAGVILLAQAFIQSPEQLLLARIASGFVLAFLSPACQAMLVRSASSIAHQGSLMAGSGIVHMLASVAAPGLAALYVAQYGFSNTFLVLGSGLIITGVCAQLFLPNCHPICTRKLTLRLLEHNIHYASATSPSRSPSPTHKRSYTLSCHCVGTSFPPQPSNKPASNSRSSVWARSLRSRCYSSIACPPSRA